VWLACRLQLVRRIGTVGSVVAVHWHARLNQIFMGTGQPFQLVPFLYHCHPVLASIHCLSALSAGIGSTFLMRSAQCTANAEMDCSPSMLNGSPTKC